MVCPILSHGAHTDHTDKHGTTPGMLARLARDGGMQSKAEVRVWLENKEEDLRGRGM